MPQMVQKFYAIKDESVIKKATIVTTVFAVIIVFSAYFTGALSHLFYDSIPLVNGKPAFDRLIPDLLTTHLARGPYGNHSSSCAVGLHVDTLVSCAGIFILSRD